MKYIRVQWIRAALDEAVWWWHELEPDGRERRKVVSFRDGHSERADASSGTDYCWLSREPPPNLDDINRTGEFAAHEISPDDFEAAWTSAAPPPV